MLIAEGDMVEANAMPNVKNTCFMEDRRKTMMKWIATTGLAGVALLFSFSAHGQGMPPGVLVQTINCSLNEGTSMAEAVQWARSVPRDETAPNLIFFRQAVYTGNFRTENDFRIASYYPSYAEMVSRVTASIARSSENRVRPGTRQSDLFTCDPSTSRLALNRTVNPGSNDGFSGDGTLMTTRFCRLNEGATPADAYAFAQGVASNYRAGGDNSLMQVYTRALGPVGNTVAGRGVVIASVPATPAAFAARMDLAREGLNALEGLTLPMACDYPAMWFTHSVHRAGN